MNNHDILDIGGITGLGMAGVLRERSVAAPD